MIFSMHDIVFVEKLTWDILARLCLGGASSMDVSLSIRSKSAKSLERDLAAIRTRRWGEPLGLGVTALWGLRSPLRLSLAGSKGLTYTELLIDPLGAIDPWAASSSRPAKDPWLGNGWVLQLKNVSLESRLPKSPLAFFGPNSLKLFNSIILLLSVVSMLPPWKLGCEINFLQSWNRKKHLLTGYTNNC